MTYNHEETKVRDPSAAREVERLRNELARFEAVAYYCPDDPDCMTAFSWWPDDCDGGKCRRSVKVYARI